MDKTVTVAIERRTLHPVYKKVVKSTKKVMAHDERGTELEFVIMVIAVSCVKLLSAHNSTQHTSRKHKV
jgi:SSU ribosomal protein S17P